VSDSDEIIIREVRVDQIIDLRWTILRNGLPRETAQFDGDNDPTTVHLAAFRADTLIACATFLRRDYEDQPAWQLRGMAVREDHQRGGLGTRLLDFAEAFLRRQNHSNLLWANARVPAAGFYERRGWTIVSEPFEYPTAGPHVKIMKRIAPIVR